MSSNSRRWNRGSTWAELAARPSDLGALANDERWRPVHPRPGDRVWTDDYCNILGHLVFRPVGELMAPRPESSPFDGATGSLPASVEPADRATARAIRGRDREKIIHAMPESPADSNPEHQDDLNS
jgi:hypothetical protein